MSPAFSRRRLLQGATALAGLGVLAPRRAAAAGLRFGPPRAFNFDALSAHARALAGAAYRPPYRPAPEVVERIDYDAHGKIRFRPDQALFAEGPGSYPATFFHLGRYFGKSVKMHALKEGSAREILYSPDYFEMPADSIARELPEDSGFAGFRLQESRQRDDWQTHDWVAFLGASYFRAIGELEQYGLSARGLAVDVAASGPEEFPDFTEFYVAPGGEAGQPVEVFALLDGPSVTGAYRFALQRAAGVVMEIEKVIYLRRPVERLGLAPLTSMYWFAEGDRPKRLDWRPEVHDSDGLALWTGGGERIWRPLNNPERVTVSSFLDDSPHGFGLLQRDREVDHYLDGVRYERRPSLWVEPLAPWGPGAVQLVEIPTDDEIHDNIVAFWVPRQASRAGDSFHLHYRLHWRAEEPYPAEDLARVVASRVGRGGEPGKPRPADVTKFVVDFAGGPLATLPPGAAAVPVATAARGELSLVFAEPIPGGAGWRAVFDLAVAGSEPVELRLFLALDGRPLSETWLFQHQPTANPRS